MRALTVCCILAGLVSTASAAGKGSLFGMVVVIDPGHGGVDPGAHGVFNNGNRVMVVEDEYVYDVSLRLCRYIKKEGGICIMTITDTKQKTSYDGSPRQVIPYDQNEVYTIGGGTVHARTRGILRRGRTVDETLRKFPRHRIVFVSIHFDATSNGGLSGVHLLAPSDDPSPELIPALTGRFREKKWLRTLGKEEFHPVVTNGDRSHGVRKIFILRGRKDRKSGWYNHVRQRVLIELGNFSNPRDVWRIRNAETRQSYASVIAASLADVNKLPLRACRE